MVFLVVLIRQLSLEQHALVNCRHVLSQLGGQALLDDALQRLSRNQGVDEVTVKASAARCKVLNCAARSSSLRSSRRTVVWFT
ncbi:MAG: hypothetical protein IPJ14_21855 [Kineosporiaceae bacterium]|nr:hypothetical protein [Kineosporiaceae bacterium]